MYNGINYVKSGALVNKKFREFFIPTVLMSMAGQLGVILDGVIVSSLINSNAMACVGICLPLNQIISAVSVVISIGAGGLISIASGARQHDGANKIFSCVMVLSLGSGIIITLLMLPFAHELAVFLASSGELVTGGYEYLRALIWRWPFMIGLACLSALVRSDGMAKLASRAVILGQVTNIALDLVFIGLLNLGLMGAALATVISDVAGLAYMMAVYFKSGERSFRFVKVFSFRLAFTIIRSGIPAALSIGLVSVKVWFIYRILGDTSGADAMKLYAVCMMCLSFVSIFIAGAHGAMIPVAGVLYGEKDYQGIRMLVRHVLKFTMTLTAVFVVFSLLFPQIILDVFSLPAALTAEGKTAVRLFSLSLPGVTATFLMMYYYTTVQERVAANILSLTEGFFAVVPAAYVLARLMGLNGVWLAFIFAEFAGFAVLLVYVKAFRKGADIFLIEKGGSDLLYDVSLKATEGDASKLSQEAVRLLEGAGIAGSTAMKAGIALEEMTVNLASYHNKDAVDVDVRIIQGDKGIILALRDNGRPFNPVEYTPEEKDIYKVDGIMFLKALAEDITYNRVLSLNQTIIELGGSSL